MRKINRKGQTSIAGMPAAVVAIGIAVIVLILSLVITQEINNTDTFTKALSGSEDNETLTTVTETGEDLSAISNAAAACTVGIVTNATDGVVISSGNFTTSNSGCTVAFDGGDINFNNTNWNVSYTFTFGDEAFTAGNQSIIGLGTFADFISIIVIALVAGIVLAIIFGVFGRMGGRKR